MFNRPYLGQTNYVHTIQKNVVCELMKKKKADLRTDFLMAENLEQALSQLKIQKVLSL